eukprot:4477394-Pleurochrysis_carterae.AAC.2
MAANVLLVSPMRFGTNLPRPGAHGLKQRRSRTEAASFALVTGIRYRNSTAAALCSRMHGPDRTADAPGHAAAHHMTLTSL